MDEPLLPLIVSPNELNSVLGEKDVIVVDLNLPETYALGHVPGAISFSFAELLDPRPPAMGFIASENNLSKIFSEAGITSESHVVAYDSEGTGKACRFLWTLDVVGHKGMSLLNGGFPAWQKSELEVELAAQQVKSTKYEVKIGTKGIADKEYILSHLNDNSVVVIDCRSAAEYAGQDIRSARGGHIPGSINMDWLLTLDCSQGFIKKSDKDLNALFGNLGITRDKEVIVHCQTHHRSSHTYIILKHLGYEKVRGYDGSWSEWGNDMNLPIEI